MQEIALYCRIWKLVQLKYFVCFSASLITFLSTHITCTTCIRWNLIIFSRSMHHITGCWYKKAISVKRNSESYYGRLALMCLASTNTNGVHKNSKTLHVCVCVCIRVHNVERDYDSFSSELAIRSWFASAAVISARHVCR